MSSSLPFDSLGIDGTLGATIIGYACSCVAIGIFLGQISRYLAMYPEDKMCYKFLVATIAVLLLIDQGLISHALYFYVISNYANPNVFVEKRAVWTIIVHVAVGAVIGAIAKLCFAVRVWRFSHHNIWVTGVIVLLTFAELGLSATYTIRCFELGFFVYLPNIKTWGMLSLGCGVLIDVFVAVTLCFYLQRLKAGYKTATTVITKLSIYAVSTGVVTSAVGLSILITYYFMPRNFIFMSLSFLLSKLYGISLLAALNTRRNIENNRTSLNRGSSERANADTLTAAPNRISRGSSARRFLGSSRRTTTLYESTAESQGGMLWRIPSMSPVPNFSMPLFEPVRYKDHGSSSTTLQDEPGSRFSA